MTIKNKPTIKFTTKEALAYIGSFFFFAVFYYTTLWVNRDGYHNPKDHYLNLDGFLNGGGIDYLLKLIFSLPVIWLMFIRFPYMALYKRLLIHVIALPVYVIIWQQTYYAITEALGMYHLRGLGSAWDLYIPSLFYIIEFSMLHAYTYFKEVQERQKLEADLREFALKSELTALKAQLNPHFLYNVFNTINASLPPGLEKTRQMIAELADLFRYQLQASKSDMVPLRDELGFTRKYLDLEKARFDERLQIVIDVDDTLLDEQVPPMLLQPLVENAVKHGITPLIKGGTIIIKIIKIGSKLAFTITDTGKGIIGDKTLIGSGTGITNTAMRLEKMFGSKLIFTDNVPQGLVINFTI